MHTQCTLPGIELKGLGKRKIDADFQGGQISSDGGALLLREINHATGLLSKFTECFEDYRSPALIEHTLQELLSQRVIGLALGYEDLNDHDELRKDPLFGVLMDKLDPTGKSRRRKRDRGCCGAGKSTLNRLELTPVNPEKRYKKITYNEAKIDHLMVEHFLDTHKQAPAEIVIDLDATDDLIHGMQEGRYFHGYYGAYCFLPLYIFCGDFLLTSRLREANIGAAVGAVAEVERIVTQIRERWTHTRIILRADSAYSTDELMSWCEENEVYYLFGQAKNKRLLGMIAKQMERARRKSLVHKKSSRIFKAFYYRTLKSWSRKRRVIAKAEHLSQGMNPANPRFVVTNLPASYATATDLYEVHYCARGDMENRIKEQQLGLFADRTSAHEMRANQLRLYFSSVAYLLMSSLRRIGLKGTDMEKAQCSRIRLDLLKIGALIKISVRRVYVAFSSGFPRQELFQQVLANIRGYAWSSG